MEYLKADEIAMFGRAIRHGYAFRKAGDVTGKTLAEMAQDRKDRDAAKDLLKELYWAVCDPDLDVTEQSDGIQLIGRLAYEMSIDEFNAGDGLKTALAETNSLVNQYKVHGDEHIAEYLRTSIRDAIKGYAKYVEDTDGKCLDESEIPDWLQQAFNLVPKKRDGQPTDPEKDADVLDGMHHILATLEQPSDSHDSKLEEDLHRYEGGDLPSCINRLIRLKGYPYSVDVLAEKKKVPVTGMLMELASDLLNEIRRARGTIKGTLKFKRMASGNIFMKCQDLNVEQVEALLENSSYSESEKMSLRKRRETLRDYCSESLRKNNSSGNATGFDRLYRAHGSKLHPQLKRLATDRSSEFDAITADLKIRRKKKAAREHPIVRKAMKIIRSRDVGNQSRDELLKLEKQTPEEHQHIWRPDLWEEFHQALAKVVEHKNEASKSS